jgi:GT2 family glycosyltransferase
MSDSLKKIIIVTPANSFTPVYVSSLLETQAFALSQKNIQIVLSTLDGSNIAELREMMAYNIISTSDDYDKMLWIDSDIMWSIEDFQNIIESPHKITCGAYMISPEGEMSIAHLYPSGNIFHIHAKDIGNKNTYMEVDFSGFGFICIDKGVFESIEPPYFANVKVPIIQDKEHMLVTVQSEDSSWCSRAVKAGYKIMFDTRIIVGHQKKTIWFPPIRQ